MDGKQPKRKERRIVDRMGRSLLHYAVIDGQAEKVRQLLESGMAVDAADDNGWTPLHFSAQTNLADVAEQLLNAGASVDARDAHGNTPLIEAVFRSRGRGDVIKLLRAHGADPYAKNNHGISALSLARTIANHDVRQFFEDLPEGVGGVAGAKSSPPQ